MRSRRSFVIAVWAVLTLLIPIVTPGVAATHNNTVTVLTDGYVKAIEVHELIPGATDNGARNVASTVALIQSNSVMEDEEVTIIADPGMVATRDLITGPLKKHGVSPEEVTHVFISHHHPDHIVNIALFPNAEIVDFWGRYKNDLWKDHGDDYEIAPGIKVIRTPGHTKEDASLLVETKEGNYILTHLWWAPDYFPAEDPLAWNPEKLEESRKEILGIADWIVPGHGKMFKNSQKSH